MLIVTAPTNNIAIGDTMRIALFIVHSSVFDLDRHPGIRFVFVYIPVLYKCHSGFVSVIDLVSD